jgi:hypothetical protein
MIIEREISKQIGIVAKEKFVSTAIECKPLIITLASRALNNVFTSKFYDKNYKAEFEDERIGFVERYENIIEGTKEHYLAETVMYIISYVELFNYDYVKIGAAYQKEIKMKSLSQLIALDTKLLSITKSVVDIHYTMSRKESQIAEALAKINGLCDDFEIDIKWHVGLLLRYKQLTK